MGIFLQIINYVFPVFFLLILSLFEYKVNGHKKRCTPVLKCQGALPFTQRIRFLLAVFLFYLISMIILAVELGFSTVHTSFIIPIFIFLSFSSIFKVFIGTKGVIISGQYYVWSEIEYCQIDLSDRQNSIFTSSYKTSIKLKDGTGKPFITYMRSTDKETVMEVVAVTHGKLMIINK
jgi:hypothetical protein